jgi:hypothetical protein
VEDAGWQMLNLACVNVHSDINHAVSLSTEYLKQFGQQTTKTPSAQKKGQMSGTFKSNYTMDPQRHQMRAQKLTKMFCVMSPFELG